MNLCMLRWSFTSFLRKFQNFWRIVSFILRLQHKRGCTFYNIYNVSELHYSGRHVLSHMLQELNVFLLFFFFVCLFFFYYYFFCLLFFCCFFFFLFFFLFLFFVFVFFFIRESMMICRWFDLNTNYYDLVALP